MFSLRDVSEHNLAHAFRIDLFDENDDERHEHLARFYDDARDSFVMRYPE